MGSSKVTTIAIIITAVIKQVPMATMIRKLNLNTIIVGRSIEEDANLERTVDMTIDVNTAIQRGMDTMRVLKG